MDISSIIVTLDYLLRMAMNMLDKLMKTLGIKTTVAETTTEGPTEAETTTVAEEII